MGSSEKKFCQNKQTLGCVRLGYSGIGIYSGIYSGYSALGCRIAGMEIQVFRNENSSQTNAYSHYSNYSYSGLIPNERALGRPACQRTVAMAMLDDFSPSKKMDSNFALELPKLNPFRA